MKKVIFGFLVLSVFFSGALVYGQSVERMKALLNEGFEFYEQQDFHRAAEKWETAIGIARDIGHKKGEGIALALLGNVYTDIGDHPKAISYYEQALKINKELGNKEEIGNNLTDLGNIYFDLGSYQKAISYLEEALKIYREIGDKGEIGYNLTGLGNIYLDIGDYQKAISYCEQALKIYREIGNKEGISANLTGLGNIYRNLNNYQKAISYYEQALEIFRKVGFKKGIGDNLTNLGGIYEKLLDYPKAISYYEQALKIQREIRDKEKTGFSLTKLGDIHNNLGDHQKAISYYEEALKIRREIGDKEGIGDNFNNLGVVYGDIGEYQKAISYYEQALKTFRELGDKEGIGDNLNNLGVIYDNLGDYPKAISYHEQVLKISREIGDKKGIGFSLSNLGLVYKNLGDYQKAISYHEQSLKTFREIGDKKGIGANFTNLGGVYERLLDYPKAISYFEQALKIKRETGDKKGIGRNIGNLGVVYGKLGDYPKAISYYEQALKIDREIGNKKGIGADLANIGVIYTRLGDYQKAISYYEQALEIKRELRDKEGIGYSLNNLGVVYDNLGNYQKAMSCLEGALKIKREIGVPTKETEANIADIYLEMGEIDKAEKKYLRLGDQIRLGRLNLVKKNYSKAIKYFDKVLKKDLESRNAEFLFADYCGLGEGYSGLKNYQKAKENYEKAIVLTEEQREGLGEGEKSKFFAAKTHGFYRTQPYEGMVGTLVNLKSSSQAFLYSENLKARVLAEAIAKGHSSVVKTLPSDLAKEEENYIIKIRGLRKEMEALYGNKAMDTYYGKEKELKKVKAEQGRFITKLRRLYPEYASINYPQPIKPLEVALKKNEVLIEFEVTDDVTYVFMLKDGKIKTREVPISRKELQELVLKYRNYFEGITNLKDLLSYKPEVGKKLYSLLFGDMLDALQEREIHESPPHLIIVPDEILGVLPFEALVTALPEKEKIGEGKYGPFPLGVKYLGDKYLISYAQSATSLTLLRSLKKGEYLEQMAFAVCDPIFSVNDRRVSQMAKAEMSEQSIKTMGAIKDWKKMGVAGVGEKGERKREKRIEEEIFPRLEKTQEIAKGIRELFGKNTTILIGEKAKEEDIVGLDFSKYKYITFATHGILDNTVPWIREPALVLTQVGNREKYDGFLTMSEVMGLKMNAEIVALTACETGVGKNVSGEGVMGMGRAFQFAGCGNVLMSLWSVAEDATVSLSNAFFKNLKEGKESKEAIRLARSEIRKNGYEHPFYWSAFILVGR